MKRIIVILLAALLFAACAGQAPSAPEPTAAVGEETIVFDSTPVPAETPAPVEPEQFDGFYDNDDGDTAVVQKYGDEYRMTASIYRTMSVEGAVGKASDGCVVFHSVDADNHPLTLTLFRDGETYTLRVDESAWDTIPASTVVSGLRRTTEEPAPESEASEPDDPQEKPRGHYVFQPKVSSVYMEEVFGKDMCDAWFNLIDAVLAGKDTFACKDQHTYDWVMGQFPELCLPILPELIDYAYDREHSVKDGVASFTYLVPPEEAKSQIEAFGTQIEDILNEALMDDYSDFEKALALYGYFSEHYTYDYETFYRMYREFVPDISTIRFFRTGTGVCQQISFAYSYLLMQAGVDATVMSGSAHQWSYVRINGRDYHIDPTFAISDLGSLAYFLMNDEQRKATGIDPKDGIITSNYSVDHPHPVYVADDDHFRPLWTAYYAPFSHETHSGDFPVGEDEYGEWRFLEFDYAGY